MFYLSCFSCSTPAVQSDIMIKVDTNFRNDRVFKYIEKARFLDHDDFAENAKTRFPTAPKFQDRTILMCWALEHYSLSLINMNIFYNMCNCYGICFNANVVFYLR